MDYGGVNLGYYLNKNKKGMAKEVTSYVRSKEQIILQELQRRKSRANMQKIADSLTTLMYGTPRTGQAKKEFEEMFRQAYENEFDKKLSQDFNFDTWDFNGSPKGYSFEEVKATLKEYQSTSAKSDKTRIGFGEANRLVRMVDEILRAKGAEIDSELKKAVTESNMMLMRAIRNKVSAMKD